MNRAEHVLLMRKVLTECEAVLPKLSWSRETHAAHGEEAELARLHTVGYVGLAEGWRVVVVSFDIEEQGFPPGTRGYDGACNSEKHNTVCRLTRELAERVFKIADAAAPGAS